MHDAYVALLIFGLLSYGLILGMLVLRVGAARAKKISFETVTVDNRNISEFAYRLSRAHANCYENLPIFIGIILVATMTGQIEIVDSGAYVFIIARFLQCGLHLYSGSSKVVPLRGLFFGVQVMLQVYWSIMLLISL